MRNELRQISSKLDDVLAKQSIEPVQPKEGKIKLDRNLKISSIQKLIAAIEREIEILKNSASSGSIESKLKLEEETATLRDKVKEVLLKNKELQRQVDGSSRKIEALSNLDEPNDQKIILEELRTSKEKLKEIDTKFQGELQRSSMIKTKIAELEKSLRDAGIDLNTIGQNKVTRKSENVAVDQHQKKRLEENLSELEDNRKGVILSAKKKAAEFEEEKRIIREEMEKINKVLKEKEHDVKLKEHEINDLKRTLRNLQIKLSAVPNIMIEGTKEVKGKDKKIGRKAGKSEVREEDKPKEHRVRKLSIHDETKKNRNSSSESSDNKKKHKKKRSDSSGSSKKSNKD